MENYEESPEIQTPHPQIKLKEKRRKYYEANKITICTNTLNKYCVNKIQKIRDSCGDKIADYIKRYPFEKCAERYLRKQLHIFKIHPSVSHYDDCFSAGMMAYLYSIHRCAEMSYDHVEPYIKKLIRIYIICALVIHNDAKNLCRENGFSEIRLDAESSYGKF